MHLKSLYWKSFKGSETNLHDAANTKGATEISQKKNISNIDEKQLTDKLDTVLRQCQEESEKFKERNRRRRKVGKNKRNY